MVTINTQFDCTQKEFVADIAAIIHKANGFKVEDSSSLLRSQSPRVQAVLATAEAIFELLVGDSPDYSDEDESFD